MAEAKTKPTGMSVDAFIEAVQPAARQADARAVRALLERVSGRPATMWGPSIVGFGAYRYRYESGREGEAPRVGFSPRSSALVVYVMDGFPGHAELLARLGRHTTGRSCLYIKKLADVDMGVLEELVTASLAAMRDRYPEA